MGYIFVGTVFALIGIAPIWIASYLLKSEREYEENCKFTRGQIWGSEKNGTARVTFPEGGKNVAYTCTTRNSSLKGYPSGTEVKLSYYKNISGRFSTTKVKFEDPELKEYSSQSISKIMRMIGLVILGSGICCIILGFILR